jgi:hypothetical protein
VGLLLLLVAKTTVSGSNEVRGRELRERNHQEEDFVMGSRSTENDYHDARNVWTIAPHELQRVEDEEQLANHEREEEHQQQKIKGRREGWRWSSLTS